MVVVAAQLLLITSSKKIKTFNKGAVVLVVDFFLVMSVVMEIKG